MAVGTVKWFNNAKGWGFIRQDEGPDVFVHYSQIAGDGFRTLREGQEVSFELRDGPKGPLAESVDELAVAADGLAVAADGLAVAADGLAAAATA